MDSPIRRDLDIIVVAINREDGTFIYNPKSSAFIQRNDKLIAIGKAEMLTSLTKLCLAELH